MDSFIETFHIDWKIILAQSINFIIVLFILYFLLIKPLKKTMSERSNNITLGLDNARQNKELLEKTKEEYNQAINKAKIKANQIFEEVKKDTENKRSEMIEEAKNDVAKIISDGKKNLEVEKLKMVEDAKKEIVSLVVLATEKLLALDVNNKFDEKIIDQIKKI